MLDRRFILDNLNDVRANCAARCVSVDLDRFIVLEGRRRELTSELEDLNRASNEHARQLAENKSKPGPDQIEFGRELKQRRGHLETELNSFVEELDELHCAIPNMTDSHAPIGATDEDNKEIGRGVTPIPAFSFVPKDHVDLGESLDLIDLDAGSKVAGHGFYFLKNQAVLLDLALQQYAVSLLVREGFTPLITPDVARLSVLQGTGYSPRGNETQVYSIADTELALIATSEITLGGLYAETIVDEAQLPILLCGLSHCYRTEAGAYGRATRGLYRVHQFTKVEMFAITHPHDSEQIHFRLLELEKEIFDGLGIPYRIVENATGDLGAMAYRKFDLEAWMPGRGDAGNWGEITSTSNCTDYQARRLGMRFREADTGKVGGLVHTLNGTAITTARPLIAILENYQQEDGSVIVPEGLRPFTGFDRIAVDRIAVDRIGTGHR